MATERVRLCGECPLRDYEDGGCLLDGDWQFSDYKYVREGGRERWTYVGHGCGDVVLSVKGKDMLPPLVVVEAVEPPRLVRRHGRSCWEKKLREESVLPPLFGEIRGPVGVKGLSQIPRKGAEQ